MDITALFTGLTSTIQSIGGLVTSAFDFFGKGKVDETEAMKQYYILQLKIKDLESYANQLQLSLTEKMMVGATWTKPLALITGITIILICILNITCRTMGWGVSVNLLSGELLLLIGLFVFVASGSTRLLMAIAEKIAERWNPKEISNATKPADLNTSAKQGG
ncbi:MAG: hypothetical protein WC455_25085 [Dehalococcoidia bacterium]|jgi:hypothetical protein